MAPRITRASNKDTHPGQIDAPRARKSAAEAQAERAAAAAIAATAATHELMKIQRVAALEARMAAEDVTENANAARPVPRPSRNEVQAFRDVKIAALGKKTRPMSSTLQTAMKILKQKTTRNPKPTPPAPRKAPKKAKPSRDLIMQERGRQESESIKAGKRKAEDIETLSATKKSKHSFTPSGVRTSYKHRSQHGRQGSTISISSDSTPTLATRGKHALPLARSETYIVVDNIKYRGLSDEDESREQASKSAIKPVKAEATPLKPLMAGIVLNLPADRLHHSVPIQNTTTLAVRTTFTNNHLPAGTIIRFRELFVPMLREWVGTLEHPWEATTNEDYIPELQSIWDTVFPDTPHTVASHGDAVYYVATQKLYEWRSHFGDFTNASLALLLSDLSDDIATKAAYVAHALGPGLPFRYLDEANKSGAFLSKLVVETFTSHIADTDSVPHAYKTDANPCGALILSLAAVERALSMTRTGKIVPSDKPSVGHFSELNWGHKTSLYVPSVAAIADSRYRRLATKAREFLIKKAGNGLNTTPAEVDERGSIAISEDEDEME
ncbi:hypothetical protein FIBSPDRAFT_955062 [Athelia psychrophila]|uniref:Uncharacterized protein n=1 Tax=Athelia psychrophila TaxID=1759441 RepID=A0A166IGH9_9AGAM|nr:hypothetical protein FIBSPDRAFT_955062 [Fibularhizoctonia sp. CBS 109695]